MVSLRVERIKREVAMKLSGLRQLSMEVLRMESLWDIRWNTSVYVLFQDHQIRRCRPPYSLRGNLDGNISITRDGKLILCGLCAAASCAAPRGNSLGC